MRSHHRINIVLLATLLALTPPALNAQTPGAGPAYSKGGCNVTAQVLNANDSGTGSLRVAIATLCPGGTITFANRFVIALQSEIVINRALTLDGSSQSLDASTGDANLVQILGGTNHRIFRVESTGDLTLRRLRLSNGTVADTGGGILNFGRLSVNETRMDGHAAREFVGNALGHTALQSNLGGGAIFNRSSGTVVIRASTFDGNNAIRGSALFNEGSAELFNSTFSNNRGLTNEGAIQNRSLLTATHITVTRNGKLDGSAVSGGLYTFGANTRTTLINSIIAGNRVPDCHRASGEIVSLGLLVQTVDPSASSRCPADFVSEPQLTDLAAHGGVTRTHAPLATSPALNVADSEFCLSTDQRGFQRPRVSACDLGALELEGRDVLFSDGFETL